MVVKISQPVLSGKSSYHAMLREVKMSQLFFTGNVKKKLMFHFICVMIWKIPPAWACIDLSVKTWQPPAPYYCLFSQNKSVIPLQLIMILSVISSHSTCSVCQLLKQSKPVTSAHVCTVDSTVKNGQLTDFDHCSYMYMYFCH